MDDIDMLSTDERMTVHNLESSTMYIISIEAKNSDGFSDRASIEFETREAGKFQSFNRKSKFKFGQALKSVLHANQRYKNRILRTGIEYSDR